MNVRIWMGLAGLCAVLSTAACTSLDKGVQQSRQKSTAGQRVERFTKFVARTVTNAAGDVLPIVTAATNEIVQEVKSDVPKVAQEFSAQASRIVSTRSLREPDR